MNAVEKIAALRARLASHDLDGFIVPRTDEYQNEYVPDGCERLAWLTGFTGSAGFAVVLRDKAIVLTDSRYEIQIAQQVDAKLFEIGDYTKTPVREWLAEHAPAGGKIGYDPKLHTQSEIDAIAKSLRPKNIALVPVRNLVDEVWKDRPALPATQVKVFSESIAGRTAAEKRDDIVAAIKKSGGHAVIITKPESIAWLLNIRASDVPHNPFALSHVIVRADGSVDWFIDSARIDSKVRAHIGNHVRVRGVAELEPGLAEEAKTAKSPVLIDYSRSPSWFKIKLETAGANVENLDDPCVALRAVKTPAERKAIAAAHVRDGAAMVKFLKWVDDNAPRGALTELDIDARLREFRAADPAFRDTSFDTIAGWAGNGAIVHYRATKEKHAKIVPPGILLIDSGGQYEDGGTTDITRTVAVGAPTDEQKKMYTLVLRGHIAVSMARFPDDVVGAQIDALARKPLWDAGGYDYGHGTGHGVGCYLSVHEEATGIHKRSTALFKPGMLISNEPGYYRENEFGIRIENLILAREDGVSADGKRKMLAFDTVTLAPYDRRLIVPEMLEAAELSWLNEYHGRVYRELSPRLDEAEKKWLADAASAL